jgi:hypothetical protein
MDPKAPQSLRAMKTRTKMQFADIRTVLESRHPERRQESVVFLLNRLGMPKQGGLEVQ